MKTFAGILAYLAMTAAIAFASIHVIATTAELKCDICADRGWFLVFAAKRDDSPAPPSEAALRGSLAAR